MSRGVNKTEVIANEMKMLDSRGENGGQRHYQNEESYQPQQPFTLQYNSHR